MKQVKGKYIRLTQRELNEIIKHEVEKQLQILMEYAIPRSEFIEKISNQCQQILENWCLVRYCSIFGRTQTKEHWMSELGTAIMRASKGQIKKNNSYETRVKAIEEAFDWNDLPSSPEHIYDLVVDKFVKEGIVTKDAYRIQDEDILKCSSDCNNAIPTIIGLIANNNNCATMTYVQEI